MVLPLPDTSPSWAMDDPDLPVALWAVDDPDLPAAASTSLSRTKKTKNKAVDAGGGDNNNGSYRHRNMHDDGDYEEDD
jgi:hypothetical protein